MNKKILLVVVALCGVFGLKSADNNVVAPKSTQSPVRSLGTLSLNNLYINWLNKLENRAEKVYHNANIFVVFKQMGIDKVLSPVHSLEEVSLDKKDTDRINSYKHRKHVHVSIQNLIDSDKIPAMDEGYLDLSGRRIVSLKGLQNIKHKEAIWRLDLDDNDIVDIKENYFVELNALEYLIINNNKIVDIKENAFAGLNALTRLDLSNNDIVDIKKNSFSGLSELETLNLSNNKLTQAQKEMIKEEVEAIAPDASIYI